MSQASVQPVEYTVRYGDTFETIAFDWKISPQAITDYNGFASDIQLTPGQTIVLPALSGL
jgi:LysM repeat protein